MEIKKPETKEELELIDVQSGMDKEFQMPDYRPQSYFTRKQVSKDKKRKLRKIAYKSKRFNRIRAK